MQLNYFSVLNNLWLQCPSTQKELLIECGTTVCSTNSQRRTFRLTFLSGEEFPKCQITQFRCSGFESQSSYVITCTALTVMIVKLHYNLIVQMPYFPLRSEQETISGTKNIKAGVLQGSVLVPLLYLIYRHDFPWSNGVQIAIFSNDIQFIQQIPYILSSGFTLEYCKKWKVKINEQKT